MYLALVATARRAAAAPSAPVMTVADIKSCGRDANKALSMLEEMRKAHQTDIYAYATAISVCSKAGEWEKALSVLSSMDSDGLLPDRPCFNAALTACARSVVLLRLVSSLNAWATMHCAQLLHATPP